MGRMVEAWEGDTCVGSQTAMVRRVAGAKKWSIVAAPATDRIVAAPLFEGN